MTLDSKVVKVESGDGQSTRDRLLVLGVSGNLVRRPCVDHGRFLEGQSCERVWDYDSAMHCVHQTGEEDESGWLAG